MTLISMLLYKYSIARFLSAVLLLDSSRVGIHTEELLTPKCCGLCIVGVWWGRQLAVMTLGLCLHVKSENYSRKEYDRDFAFQKPYPYYPAAHVPTLQLNHFLRTSYDRENVSMLKSHIWAPNELKICCCSSLILGKIVVIKSS